MSDCPDSILLPIDNELLGESGSLRFLRSKLEFTLSLVSPFPLGEEGQGLNSLRKGAGKEWLWAVNLCENPKGPSLRQLSLLSLGVD